ncbi:CotH kinase family protein [Effusibacillus dendaii]|uniref:Inner spore coat protein H n=1 Tax=Effusibacillus dendaii TaxID=2743772 RepID=A0A7I8DDZ2_9BACL|nr:CotH kinase family protein [Effusibacillus dendaii]BCJ88325.1 inner spore coat protein H [Effusibacillus dendaii]
MTALPTYSLFIHPNDLRDLRADIWSDELIAARLKKGEKIFPVEICYRGSHIRKLPKKSYLIQFKSSRKKSPVPEFHLNAEYNDPSLIRNRLSFHFFKRIGALAPEASHIFLKVNGEPAGLYLQIESVDEFFLKKRGLPPGNIYYAINDNANFSLISPIMNEVKSRLEKGYELKCGKEEDFGYLRKLIYVINSTPQSDFPNEIVKHIAIEPYLRWLIGVVCTQNFDGFIQNYALYRNSETGIFEILPWDYDATWGRDINGELMSADYIPITGYNTLTARILDVYDFRKRYREMITEILETAFTKNELEPVLLEWFDTLRPYLKMDPFKKKNELDAFEAEFELILRYIEDRNRYLVKNIASLK